MVNKRIVKVGLSVVCILLGIQVYLKLASLRNSNKAVGIVVRSYETAEHCHNLHFGRWSSSNCRQRYADVEYINQLGQKVPGRLLIDETHFGTNSDVTPNTQVNILYDQETNQIEKDNFITAYGMSIFASALILLMLYAIIFA